MTSLKSRIAGTVIVGVCWLVFIILFLAFYAGEFDFWQDLAIFLVSAIIATGMLAIVWIRMISV